ncbi:MAG: hypothetical protein ACREHD_31240, partial [Pirellulales bacterium]
GMGLTLATSSTYYVAVSSDAVLPQALDATFNAGSINTQVRLEPIDSVNRIAEDHIGSEGGETAQPASSLTTLFNSDGPINFNAPNLSASAVTSGPVLLNSTTASYIDVATTATGQMMSGQTISVTYNGVSKVFEFTTGTLPAGDTNIPIAVGQTDTAPIIASDAVQAIDTAFGASVASIDTTSASRIDLGPQAVASTSGAQLTLTKPGGPTQVQQIAALDTSAVPFGLGDVVLFVNQGPTPATASVNVPGHLETVNPFTGTLESDVGALPGALNLTGNGYDDIAMRNDGELYGITVNTNLTSGLGNFGSSQYTLIDTGNATTTNKGATGIAAAPSNVGVQFNALAFVQTGTTRALYG